MEPLTAFGLFAVTAMLVCYAAEDRSPYFILAFAAACALGSVYGFMQGAWPFGLVEAIWSVVADRAVARAKTVTGREMTTAVSGCAKGSAWISRISAAALQSHPRAAALEVSC